MGLGQEKNLDDIWCLIRRVYFIFGGYARPWGTVGKEKARYLSLWILVFIKEIHNEQGGNK